jgi:hypothetical protein
MKVEQKIAMVYTVLGILSGFLTNYMIGFGLTIAVLTPFIIYFISFPFLTFLVKKKRLMLFYNSFVTFVLVWVTIWILMYNLVSG